MSAEALALLEKFCLKGDRDLADPFVIGAHTYATNRRIVIRLEGIIEGARPKGPPANELEWFLFEANPVFLPLALTPKPVVIPCIECRLFSEPRARCRECHGTGRHRCAIPKQIGNQAFSDIVLEQLYQLPEPRIAPNPVDPFGPGLVRFSGFAGEGLVMPLSR